MKNFLFIGGCGGSYPSFTGYMPIFDDASAVDDPEARMRFETRSRLKYGSRTTSFLIWIGDKIFIIDNGFGVEPISNYVVSRLRKEGMKDRRINVFQTHFHMDHTHGLHLNAAILEPGLRLDFYSPELSQSRDNSGATFDLQRPLMEQIIERYFPKDDKAEYPVAVDWLKSDRRHLVWYPGMEDTIDGVVVKSVLCDHPGGAVAFRLEHPSIESVAILTDHEMSNRPEPEILALIDGAGLLLVDCQYTEAEAAGKEPVGGRAVVRRKFGHGTVERVAARISECQQLPKRIIFVHHDPARDDKALDDLDAFIAAHWKKIGLDRRVESYALGREGKIHYI